MHKQKGADDCCSRQPLDGPLRESPVAVGAQGVGVAVEQELQPVLVVIVKASEGDGPGKKYAELRRERSVGQGICQSLGLSA